MKLIKKTSSYFLRNTIITLLITGIASFFLFQTFIQEENKEALILTSFQIKKNTKHLNDIQEIKPFIEFRKTMRDSFPPAFSTITYSESDLIQEGDGKEYFLELKQWFKIENQPYILITRNLDFDPIDIIKSLGITFALLIALLLFLAHFSNKYMSKQLWKDFLVNLNTIKSHDYLSSEKLSLRHTHIDEIDHLNTIVQNIFNKIKTDYISNKTFTDNLTHEIQTPIAVILSKIEQLLNDSDLTEKHQAIVSEAYSASNRLSKLSKSLTLLSRIEHEQFSNTEKTIVLECIDDQLNIYRDLIELKHIQFELKVNGNLFWFINKELCLILVRNLMINAINHNIDNGMILVVIANERLTISNTSKSTKLDQAIFDRFNSKSENNQSMGLGLSIVKAICNVYNLNLEYRYEDNLHSFSVSASHTN